MGVFEVVELVGGLVVGYFLVKFALWLCIRLYCYHPWAKPVDFSKYGEWSVVTGGTDGIGAEYARQLALHGQNIIIVGRNAEKLGKMKREIEARSTKRPTQVLLVQADLSKQDEIRAACARLKTLCREKEVGILVNNAGVSYHFPEYFHLIEDNENVLNAIVNVNCAAMVQISAAVLGPMNDRNKGLIVNIGSLSGQMVSPLLSVYSASKTFVDHFSRCLFYEYCNNGVAIQHISPAFVATKMSKMRESLFTPSPRRFVQSALSSAGRLKDTCGYFGHDLQAALFRLVPQFIFTKFCTSLHQSLRKKAYRKYKKQ